MNVDELERALADLADLEGGRDAEPVAAIRHRLRRSRRRRRAVGVVFAVVPVVVAALVLTRSDERATRVTTSSPTTAAVVTEPAPTKPSIVVPTIGPELNADVHPVSSSNVWVLTDRRLLHTDDAGASWQASALPWTPTVAGAVLFPVLAVVDGHSALAARLADDGTSVTIVRSDDAAATTTSSRVAVAKAPTSVALAMAGSDIGFLAVGYDYPLASGDLFRTDDGGRTWSFVASGAPAGGLWFTSATDGYADGGGLYRTDDGGHSWTRLHPPGWDETGGPDLGAPHYRVEQSSDSDLVIETRYQGGMNVAITYLASSDRGETWSDVTPPFNGPINGTGPQPAFAIAPDGSYRVLLGAIEPELASLFTFDGSAWRSESTNLAMVDPALIRFTSLNDAWTADLNGVYSTTDGGRTWTAVSLPA